MEKSQLAQTSSVLEHSLLIYNMKRRFMRLIPCRCPHWDGKTTCGVSKAFSSVLSFIHAKRAALPMGDSSPPIQGHHQRHLQRYLQYLSPLSYGLQIICLMHSSDVYLDCYDLHLWEMLWHLKWAWEHFERMKGWVLCPGCNSLAVLGEQWSGEEEGIHIPLPIHGWNEFFHFAGSPSSCLPSPELFN